MGDAASDASPASSESSPSSESILLSVPASGPYGRIARMSGAALALRRGLSLAAVEDLRLAIDEALILLLGQGDQDGSVDLEFLLDPNAISIEFVPNFTAGPPDLSADAVERFVELASPLLTTFDIDSDSGVVRLHKSGS